MSRCYEQVFYYDETAGHLREKVTGAPFVGIVGNPDQLWHFDRFLEKAVRPLIKDCPDLVDPHDLGGGIRIVGHRLLDGRYLYDDALSYLMY